MVAATNFHRHNRQFPIPDSSFSSNDDKISTRPAIVPHSHYHSLSASPPIMLFHPLAIPIALTILSAIAQLAGRLYATRKIRAAQDALQRRRIRHACAIARHQRRQHAARRRIAARGFYHTLPPALADYAPRIWLPDRPDGSLLRRLFRRLILRSGGIDERIPSQKRIILPKVASTAASIVYKTNSPALMRLLMPALRPALAFASETAAAAGRAIQLVLSRAVQFLTAASAETGGAATVAPRLATAGGSLGAGGGILARIAVAGIAVIGYLIGPALAAVSIYLDLRKVRRARRELTAASAQMDKYEAEAAAITAALENIAPANAADGDDYDDDDTDHTDTDTDAGDDDANDDDAGAAPAPPSFAAPV